MTTFNGDGEPGALATAQNLLQMVFRAYEATSVAAELLETRLKKRSSATFRDADMCSLQELIQRVEKCSKKLNEVDNEFTTQITAGGVSTDLKIRKLSNDYRQRIDVKACLARTQVLLKRAHVVILNLRKAMKDERQCLFENVGTSKEETKPAPSTKPLPSSKPLPSAKPRPSASPNESNQAVTSMGGMRLLYAPKIYEESPISAQEKAVLRSVAKDSSLVQEMATEVGSLIAVQDDDVNRLQENTEESVGKTLEGVNELSEHKRRQVGSGVTKAAFGTAAIGGLVGIIGGPVGVAIGASVGGVVGLAAGHGVAMVKKQSINAEIRRIKAMLSAKKHQKGDFVVHLLAFEVEVWSYFKRKWVVNTEERRWTDEFGELITGAHPETNMTALEARMCDLAAARLSVTTPEEEQELNCVHAEEIKKVVLWEWATPKWEIIIDRPQTDVLGWDYSSIPTSDTWRKHPVRGDVVRRRLWSRSVVGFPQKIDSSASEKKSKIPVASGDSQQFDLVRGDEEVQNLWHGIHRDATMTNTVLSESTMQVYSQGKRVGEAERNAAIVADMANYSDRIIRASKFSGAIRNLVGKTGGGTVGQVDILNRELEIRQSVLEQEKDRLLSNNSNQLSGQVDIVDATSRKFSENLHIATQMAKELELQNDQLDRTAQRIEKSKNSMRDLAKKVR